MVENCRECAWYGRYDNFEVCCFSGIEVDVEMEENDGHCDDFERREEGGAQVLDEISRRNDNKRKKAT